MRLIRESITTKELRAIRSRIRAGFYNVEDEKERVLDAANKHRGLRALPHRGQTLSPTMTQFRVRIRVSPVTVGMVVVKTAAAELTVTVTAYIKMVAAEILFANRT